MTAIEPELAAAVGGTKWYHTIDFGNGLVSEGSYDHRPYLESYGFPADMTGMKVLDVGRASGFFSFEFERRGADVLSVELPSRRDKDFVGGEAVRDIRSRMPSPENDATGGRDDFALAHRLLNSNVRSLYCNIYDLSPERTDGQLFDLAFLGSILCHTANPMAALTAVRSVTRGSVYVANPFEPERWQSRPTARFVGRKASSMTLWWIPTIKCMEEMLYAAGFSNVEIVSKKLVLKMRSGSTSPHFVLRASAEGTEDWQAVINSARSGYRSFWPRRAAGAVARRMGFR